MICSKRRDGMLAGALALALMWTPMTGAAVEDIASELLAELDIMARAEDQPDWPLWGFDATRAGAAPAAMVLPQTLHLHWVRTLPPPQRAWPRQFDDGDKLDFDLSYSPVVLSNRLFVASMTTDRLTAYAADSGEELWRFYADGPMRVAPAAWRDRVFTASDDGRLYCLDAASGELKWAYDAAPAGHRVLGNQRVISMWPVRGGPVVADGTVYFGAGVWPFLGTFIIALDAESGAVQWINMDQADDWQRQPHGGAYAFAGLSPQGYLAVAGDRLVVAGGRASPGLFDRRDGTLLHHAVQYGKGSGGYRVRIHDDYYFNHGMRFHLRDGGQAGSERLTHPARTALRERTAAVADQVQGTIFERLVAGGRLYVVTRQGRLYAFGAEPVDQPPHFTEPATDIAPDDSAPGRLAEQILAQTGVRDGYALVLGAGDGALLAQLAMRSELHLTAIEPDPERRAAARRRLDDAGLYGTRVSIVSGQPGETHYPATIASLVVAADPSVPGRADAGWLNWVAERLRPYGGTAWLAGDSAAAAETALAGLTAEATRGTRDGNVVLLEREGPLPGAGQWTHQHADAAQTVMSPDRRVRPPFGPIWFGGPSHDNVLPRHAAGPRPQVAGGRLVILGVETISARCVFTGRELWVREFPGIGHPFTNLELEERWAAGASVYMTNQPGATYIGSPYVTLPDGIYLRYQGHVYRLAPDTGALLAKWPLPAREPEREKPDWGHISVSGDFLITTTDPHIFGDGQLGTHSDDRWDGASSERLIVMNRHTGEVLWTRDAAIGFRHNAIASADGTLYVNDLLSEHALELALRRGRDIEERPRLYALELATGAVRWTVESEVFGTFLSYSAQHDVLLEGGTRDGRRHADDEPSNRMLARRGADGAILWTRGAGYGRYDGPVIIRGDMIIPARPGPALNLISGEPYPRTHPVTGEESGWRYWRTYGCGTANAGEHVLLFRSGAAGFADLEHDGGTSTLGGFRAGCTANLIPAEGILNAPDYTRTCTCSYQAQTSLGLVHMPEMEMWMAHAALDDPDVGAIKRAGINLGAPGARRAPDGTFWVEWPRSAAPTPSLEVSIEPAESLALFRRHALTVSGDDGALAWVGASGIEGLRRIRIDGLAIDSPDTRYTIRLHLAEPLDIQAGARMFDIWLQGQRLAEAFDTVAQADGPRRMTRVEARGVTPHSRERDGATHGRIEIELAPAGGALHEPLLCGLEIVMEDQ